MLSILGKGTEGSAVAVASIGKQGGKNMYTPLGTFYRYKDESAQGRWHMA